VSLVAFVALFSGSTSFSRLCRMECTSFRWFGRKVSNPHLKDQNLASCHWTTPERLICWRGQWVPPPLLVGGSHACICQHLDPEAQQAGGTYSVAFSLPPGRIPSELHLRWRHRLDFHQRGPGCNRVPQSSVTVPGLRRRASNPRRRWLTATRSSAELLRTARGKWLLPTYRHGVPTPGFRAENPADFLYPMAAS
jgi:hypothetical protein